MWKKTDEEEPEVMSTTPSVRPQPVREQAIIGASLVVKGDVAGDEDLLIQGKVEGKVTLQNNSITVGRNGQVKADLYGKTINVEGNVQGNLFADENIVIRQSGSVRGNLQAPRVTLEEGSKFKGSIDMEGPAPAKSASPTVIPPAGASTEREKDKDDRKSPGQLGMKLNNPSKA
ncbi:MAG: polymer-forming cytoskeletal protein [Acidobacteriota bacterium]|jgi:cytoskeletal protein CcmA (bactofilin family)